MAGSSSAQTSGQTPSVWAIMENNAHNKDIHCTAGQHVNTTFSFLLVSLSQIQRGVKAPHHQRFNSLVPCSCTDTHTCAPAAVAQAGVTSGNLDLPSFIRRHTKVRVFTEPSGLTGRCRCEQRTPDLHLHLHPHCLPELWEKVMSREIYICIKI